MSEFIKPVDEYKRNLNYVDAYFRDMATGLSLAENIPFEDAMAFVKEQTGPNGAYPLRDPDVKYVGRDENGDREFRFCRFSEYIGTIVQNDYVVSPSLSVYLPKKVQESMTAKYIAKNVKRRAISKSEGFLAKEAGDLSTAAFKDLEQNNAKIKNNALSGAHVSKSTPLVLKSIHASLTSMCRSASGYANSNNEKITCGNRHYWSPEIVTSNILHIINTVDMESVKRCMSVYSLHVPTADEVMSVIERSSRNYWRDNRMESIRSLVNGLNDAQRVAFVYTSDLYHIRKFNDALMRDWLGTIAKPVKTPLNDYTEYLDKLNEESTVLTALLCAPLMEGKSFKKFKELSEETKGILGGTAKVILEVSKKYELLVKTFFVSDVMPCSLANLPDILRRGAVLSDTDSTVFTVQEWLEWYSGEISSDLETTNIGHVVAYIASCAITHILATMSTNVGVQKSQLFQYAMKSEYWFPVFALTSRAKTYYALRGAQEGIVFKEPELEKKGAVLKASNSPQYIVTGAEDLIVSTLKDIAADKKISARKILTHIADIERDLFKKISSGSPEFFKRLEVKPLESYTKGPYQSNYVHKLLWDAVFAPKYGNSPDAPYQVIRVSLDLPNKTAFNEWLTNIKDKALAQRLVEFLKEAGKTEILTMLLPTQVITASGMPVEILEALKVRQMVRNIMEPYYVMVESIGFYFIDDNDHRMISDEY